MLPSKVWLQDALCAGKDDDGEIFFPSGLGKFPTVALQMCSDCPVRRECLEWAIETEANDPQYVGSYGVFGGVTGPKRQQLVLKIRREKVVR